MPADKEEALRLFREAVERGEDKAAPEVERLEGPRVHGRIPKGFKDRTEEATGIALVGGVTPPPPPWEDEDLRRELLGILSAEKVTPAESVDGPSEEEMFPIFAEGGLKPDDLVEGVAEATAAITKVFSGAISDHLGKRKLLAGIGYGLAAATKPIFPLATTINWVFAARFVDRVGKGIRGAPRDALLAEIAPPELRGAAYGLRQSLDSVGAFAGPLGSVIDRYREDGDARDGAAS